MSAARVADSRSELVRCQERKLRARVEWNTLRKSASAHDVSVIVLAESETGLPISLQPLWRAYDEIRQANSSLEDARTTSRLVREESLRLGAPSPGTLDGVRKLKNILYQLSRLAEMDLHVDAVALEDAIQAAKAHGATVREVGRYEELLASVQTRQQFELCIVTLIQEILLEVAGHQTIAEVEEQVATALGWSVKATKIFHDGAQLHRHQVLRDCGLSSENNSVMAVQYSDEIEETVDAIEDRANPACKKVRSLLGRVGHTHAKFASLRADVLTHWTRALIDEAVRSNLLPYPDAAELIQQVEDRALSDKDAREIVRALVAYIPGARTVFKEIDSQYLEAARDYEARVVESENKMSILYKQEEKERAYSQMIGMDARNWILVSGRAVPKQLNVSR